MQAYMIQDGDGAEVVLGETMTDAIKRHVSKVLSENTDDPEFVYTEDNIQSCALLGEVYNWSQFSS